MLKKMRKMLKNERGLTLIELLAVIVILGIIAAIAVPSIGGIINKSKDDAKVAEAIQLINSAKLAHSNDSEIKNWKHTGATATTGTGATPAYGGLSEYVSNVEDEGLDYIVKYEGGIYSIKNHDASSVVTAATGADGFITEKQLTDEAK
ncbi:pilus assembly FimT family protein [Rossellomorea sp. LJF3]|uniref:pilus assembly FimT family protein n=1 Tax=Rossellomorea sp. LJF3 TaxID=3126099 RepID=UPI00300C2383